MLRRRISAKTRSVLIVAALTVTSAVASQWRIVPDTPRRAQTVIDLMPPIFTTLSAQPFVSTGCKRSPVGNHGTPAKAGVFGIAMNSFSLVDHGPNDVAGGGDDVEQALLSSETFLNFGIAAGLDPGKYFDGTAPIAIWEGIKGVMGDKFKVLCSVTCDPDGAGPLATETYLTKGSTTPSGAPFDTPGGEAFESSLDITNGQGPQSFSFTFPANAKLEVTATGSARKNFAFGSGECELFSFGGGNFKILPVAQASSRPE